MDVDYEQLDTKHNIETRRGVVSVDYRYGDTGVYLATSGFDNMPREDGSPNPTPALISGGLWLSADEARIVGKAILSAVAKADAEREMQEEQEAFDRRKVETYPGSRIFVDPLAKERRGPSADLADPFGPAN